MMDKGAAFDRSLYRGLSSGELRINHRSLTLKSS